MCWTHTFIIIIAHIHLVQQLMTMVPVPFPLKMRNLSHFD